MAKFEVYQSGKNNEFRFRLKADNGQTILSSEGYTTKASCMNGIESVKKNSADAKRFTKDQNPDKNVPVFNNCCKQPDNWNKPELQI